MIISHSKKFIFVRGYRNAGTTVKAALSTLCGDQDIISEYNPGELAIVANSGLRGEQNNIESDGSKIIPFNAHWTLSQAYDRFPEIVGYDVIVMCRNPYERVYSLAKWLCTKDRYRAGLAALPSTLDVVRQHAKDALGVPLAPANMVIPGRMSDPFEIVLLAASRVNWDSRMTGNTTVVRYEHLKEDLRAVFDRCGAPMPELLRLKSTEGVLSLPWQDVFAREEIALINRVFKDDFEQYDYEMLQP